MARKNPAARSAAAPTPKEAATPPTRGVRVANIPMMSDAKFRTLGEDATHFYRNDLAERLVGLYYAIEIETFAEDLIRLGMKVRAQGQLNVEDMARLEALSTVADEHFLPLSPKPPADAEPPAAD